MKKRRFLIDGRFLASNSTGIDRYALESIKELDLICQSLDISILVPGNVEKIPQYKNIKIIKSKHILCWTQLVFAIYARKMRAIPVNLCNEVSLLAPKGIVCLHDVCYQEDVDYFPKEEVEWFRKIYKRICKKTIKILTVSEFSKQRIVKLLNVHSEKIVVAGNGWQHFEQVICDEEIFVEYPSINKGQYYLTLSSANPNKNIKWVIEASKNNTGDMFVIVGKNIDRVIDFNNYKNVLYLGYLSDEKSKALMKYCKAFIFPSIYEGFGIPPMEALSVGATAIVSKTSSLPEIYGNSVHYINPMDTNIDFNKILCESIDPPDSILNKYSWEITAKRILDVLEKI